MPISDQIQNTTSRLPIHLPALVALPPRPDPCALPSPAERQAQDAAAMQRTLEAFGLPEISAKNA